MDAFSSSPLMETFPSSRFSSPAPSPTRTETDFPIDVDQSFNSSMSITNDDSPPILSPTPYNANSAFSPVFGQRLGQPSSNSMLSPLPAPVFTLKPKRPDPVPLQSTKSVPHASSTFQPAKRAFGRELSLNVATQKGTSGPATLKANAKLMPPPAVPDGKLFKPRGALPMQWTSSQEGKLQPVRPMLVTREVSEHRLLKCSS